MQRAIQVVTRNLTPIFLLALLTFGSGLFARQAANTAARNSSSGQPACSIHQGDQISGVQTHPAAITEDSEDSQVREEREQKESSRESSYATTRIQENAQTGVDNAHMLALSMAFHNREIISLVLLFHAWKGFLI
ncbi:MAG: hypothetical protein H6606_00230 [Flavobacteriales bacterium]|nr:hypothetical protein [Flavobacteriales bacterium]